MINYLTSYHLLCILSIFQTRYPEFRKIEVELTQEKELDKLPERPSMFFFYTQLILNQRSFPIIIVSLSLNRL